MPLKSGFGSPLEGGITGSRPGGINPTFNPRTQEAGAGGSLVNSRPAWSIESSRITRTT